MWYAIIIFGLFIWLTKKIDKYRYKKSVAKVEEIQAEMYDLIDKSFGALDAEEKKEDIELFIHGYWENNLGWDYKPEHVEEVTTKRSRKKILKEREELAKMPVHTYPTQEECNKLIAKRFGITDKQFEKDRKNARSEFERLKADGFFDKK